jgi:serine/threonine protein kinase
MDNDPLVGQLIGKYRVERVLGAGGMGRVYAAIHPQLGKKAAVKLLNPELAANRQVVERFFNEARAAAQLEHAGIVEVFDFDWLPDGRPYILLELLDGEPLSRRVAREGRLAIPAAVEILAQVCDAVGEAHKHGIIHRDLKPDNIFLVSRKGTRGLVKVLDFGIAKLQGELNPGAVATRSGVLIGTPAYMSPEQAFGRHSRIGPPSDVYAMGIIAYQILAGRLPIEITNDMAFGDVMLKHAQEIPRPLRELRPEIPELIDRAVQKALAKEPAARFATTTSFGHALVLALQPGQEGLVATLLAGGALPDSMVPELPHVSGPIMALPTPQSSGPLPVAVPSATSSPGFEPTAPGPPAAIGGRPFATPVGVPTGPSGPLGATGPSGPAGPSAPGPSVPPPQAIAAVPASLAMPAQPGFAGPMSGHPSTLSYVASSVGAEPRRRSRVAGALLVLGVLVGVGVAALVARGHGSKGSLPGGATGSQVATPTLAPDAGAGAAQLVAFQAAVGKGDFESAVALYQAMPAGSPYLAQAAPGFKLVSTAYVAAHLQTLDADLTAGDCPGADREVDLIRAVDPVSAAAPASQALARCKPDAGVGTVSGQPNPPTNPQGPQSPQPTTGGSGSGAPPSPTCDAAALGAAADDAADNGDYDAAKNKAQAALACAGDKSDAWEALGTVACANGDSKGARDAYKQLGKSARAALVVDCAQFNINPAK